MEAAEQLAPLLVVAATAGDAIRLREAILADSSDLPKIECASGIEDLERRLAETDYQAILLCVDAETSPGPARVRQLCAGREPPPIIAVSRNVQSARSDLARTEGVDEVVSSEELTAPRLAESLRTVAALRAARRMAIGADRRWRRLFENAPVGLFELDGRGRLIRANPALLRLLGDEDVSALRERLGADRLFANSRERLNWLRAIAAGRPIRDMELMLSHSDGGTIHVIAGCAPVRDERGLLGTFEGTVTDVTRLKELGRQFVLAQKMEAVGQMTGGIAHDFSNLLTIILGNVYLMEKSLDPTHPAAATLSATRKAARQGADLTRRLLAFARQESLEPELVDLDQRLEELRPLLERTLDGKARLSVTTSGAAPRALVDPAQLESAILNLAINARDAMPDGGELSVTIEAGDPGRLHCITVADTGTGLAPEVRERLFEPFFSTKQEGSGLGLAMVHAFVTGAGGEVDVQSEPGAGTAFRLRLPAAIA